MTAPVAEADSQPWCADIPVSHLKDMHRGKEALIVAGGLSAASWREHKRNGTILIAVNGSANVIGEEVDFALAMEPTSGIHGPEWFFNKLDKPIKVHHARNYLTTQVKSPDDPKTFVPKVEGMQPRTCLGFRAVHTPGWDPREYVNPINSKKGFHSEIYLAYKKLKIPMPRRTNFREEGFLRGPTTECRLKEPIKLKSGPVSKVRNGMGTSSLCALHLACYLGCDKISSIGMDFHFKPNKNNWYPWKMNPRYEPGNNRYMMPEFMNTVSHGKKEFQSVWWFVASAAYLMSIIKPKLQEVGIDWVDKSAGLLQIPGIESLNYLDGTGMAVIKL